MLKLRLTDITNNKAFTRQLPTEWADIKPSKRHKCLKLVYQGNRLNLLFELLNVPTHINWSVGIAELAALQEMIKNIDLLPNPDPILPNFTLGFSTYYLPKKNFDNGTALQFATALEHYQNYANSNNVQDLRRLIAVLATEKGVIITENTDIRLFSRDFVQMPEYYVAMVLCYFEGILKLVNEIGTKFGLWDDNKEENTEGGALSPAQVFGWKAVFRNLADHDPSRYDVICQRPFFEILQILIERKMQADFLVSQQKTTVNEDT
jgi:hypothetical protein